MLALLLNIGSFLVGLPKWVWRRLKRRFVDRSALVVEGARVVTPVIETTERASLIAVALGSNEEISERMQALQDDWVKQRTELLTYAHGHPSENVRKLGLESSAAVEALFALLRYVYAMRHTNESAQAAMSAPERQDAARAKADALMQAIRDY